MFGVDKEERERLKERYLGKKVKVVINDPYRYINEVGIVELVDDAGQLHGTWGGLAAIPGKDSIQIIE